MTRFQTMGERTGSQEGKERGLEEHFFFLVHILFSFFFFQIREMIFKKIQARKKLL